jgi:glutaredoxin-like protein NrdH
MTKEFLKQHNAEFEEMNVEENEEALEQIKASGCKRLPVVIVTKNNSIECAFSGFQIDLLDELVQ